jgi:signal transduction histidine kinase
VIQSYAGLLATGQPGPLTSTQREFLGGIDAKVREVSRLLDDFLDLSRLQAGRLELRPEPVGLGELLQYLQEEWRAAASRREVGLDCTVVPEDLAATADPLRLRQILEALLGRAIAASGPGSTVRIRARREAERLFLEVTDGGPALTAAERAQLLEPYGRVPADGAEGGSALALTVAAGLAAGHGGDLTVTSPAAGGTQLRLDLPA